MSSSYPGTLNHFKSILSSVKSGQGGGICKISFYEIVRAHTVRQLTLVRNMSLCLTLFTQLPCSSILVKHSYYFRLCSTCTWLFGAVCLRKYQLKRAVVSMNGLWCLWVFFITSYRQIHLQSLLGIQKDLIFPPTLPSTPSLSWPLFVTKIILVLHPWISRCLFARLAAISTLLASKQLLAPEG